MFLKLLFAGSQLLFVCLAQSGLPARKSITVIAVGDSGERYEFKLKSDEKSRAACGAFSSKYETSHNLSCTVGSKLRLIGSIRNASRGGQDVYGSLDITINYRIGLYVIPLEQQAGDFDPNPKRPSKKLVLPKGYCAQPGIKWMKIGLVNSSWNGSMVLDSRNCSVEVSHLNFGLYAATLFIDGNPIGLIKFTRHWSRDSQITPEVVMFSK